MVKSFASGFFMFRLLIFLPIIFILSCQKSCKREDQKVLRIGTNASYVPFEFVNDLGELSGFDIDLGYELGKALNKKVEFKEFDFDALILALKKEQVDIVLSGLSITASRTQEIAMIPYEGEPIRSLNLLFYGDIKREIRNFNELKEWALEKNLKINVQAGHFLEDFLKKIGIPTKPLQGPPEQLLDIKYGKSLAAAVDPKNAMGLLSTVKELHSISLDLPEEFWDLGYGVGIKKSRLDLLEDIKKAIETLRNNGVFKKLEDKWLNKPKG